MADSAFKTQVSRDENANSASNVLFIQIADDAGNVASITGGALDVNATVTLETAYVDDAAFVIGTDKVNAQGFLADETATDSVDEGDIGLARMTLDRRMITAADQRGTWNITTLTGITNDVNIADGGNSITVDDGGVTISIDDGGGSITVDGTVAISGTVTVTATDLDIRDLTHVSDSVQIGDGTDLLAVNADGSINVVVAGSAGTAVADYDTATVAGAATSNHDYTVTASETLSLKQVLFAASGKMKIEVQTGPLASLATKAVAFIDQDSFGEYTFAEPIAVPDTSTGTVRVIRTNRQGSSQDVYTTILGNSA